MHVAIFTDLHPMSLGGLQTSVRLQRKYLERMGVEVTIFSSKSSKAEPSDKTVILPSRKVSPDGEYATMFNVQKAYQVSKREFDRRKIDIIHLQGDFATAAIALKLARDFDIPLIHHAHTKWLLYYHYPIDLENPLHVRHLYHLIDNCLIQLFFLI